MKPRPPLEIFIAAAVIFFLGGWLAADGLVDQGVSWVGFTTGLIIISVLGFGLLQGWVFSQAWIIVLSGLVSLSLAPALWSCLFPDYPTSRAEAFSELISFSLVPVTGLLVCLCAFSPAAREWCKGGGQNPVVSLALGGLACFLGLLVAMPMKIDEQKRQALFDSIYPISTEFTFQAGDNKTITDKVYFQGELSEYRAQEYPPKLTDSRAENPDGSTRILLGGLANRPVLVGFIANGYEPVEFRITKNCPRSVTLTLLPAKEKQTAAK